MLNAVVTRSFALLSLVVSSAHALSPDIETVHDGDIVEAPLSELHPTQSSVGFDEVYYRLERFAQNREKLFDAFCKASGQSGVSEFTEASDLHNRKSFVCREPLGSHREDMNTVVIAPNGELYLTNGHHKSLAFWQAAGAGPEVKLPLVVARDYRAFPSMEVFWEHMKDDQNVWLFDAPNHPISAADLPASLGLDHFSDDPYRSLMYFTDHIAWEKPERIINSSTGKPYPAVPFVEFYWLREVRKTVDLTHYDMTNPDGYCAAMRAGSEAIMNLDSDNVGGSGKTVEEMGQRHVGHKKLERAIGEWKEKLAGMLQYKSSLLQRAVKEK